MTVLGRSSVIHIPGFMLKAAMEEMAMVALEGQRVLPKRLTESGFTFRRGASERVPPSRRGGGESGEGGSGQNGADEAEGAASGLLPSC
ncbi:DUF1731 domain-containing protein [Pyxidicoccus parkwayensis]|uniref:DUF1731 domain-containing protein n=1 Tax=Pyxidicoccus parkwayensis TaxID=2813578 RepID=UPI001F505493|nr:DUF1731 domain-containing protein [Pyxidicoccus parkwaysis]